MKFKDNKLDRNIVTSLRNSRDNQDNIYTHISAYCVTFFWKHFLQQNIIQINLENEAQLTPFETNQHYRICITQQQTLLLPANPLPERFRLFLLSIHLVALLKLFSHQNFSTIHK